MQDQREFSQSTGDFLLDGFPATGRRTAADADPAGGTKLGKTGGKTLEIVGFSAPLPRLAQAGSSDA
jgi:hypothetical protein